MYYARINARRGSLVITFCYFLIISTPHCVDSAAIGPHCYLRWRIYYTDPTIVVFSFFVPQHHIIYVVGGMKMENIVPRVGIEPTSLAFWASELPLHHVGSLMSPLYPQPPVYVAPCLRRQCRLLHIYIFF